MSADKRRFFKMALPQMQWKLIGLIIAFGTGTCVLAVVGVSVAMIQLRAAVSAYPEVQILVDQYSDRAMIYLVGSFLISAFVNMTVFFVVLKRLAGPIRRLRDYFKRLALQPDTQEMLHFRGGDFFDDLPPVVNQALKEIRARRNVKREPVIDTSNRVLPLKTVR